MQTTLAGRSGILTDALSPVGRAIALELGREGARLALGYRAYRGADFDAVEQLARDVVRVGGEALPMRLPADTVGELEQAIGRLVELWGWVDFVVDMTSECAVGRAALPWLLERGRGRIVFVSPPGGCSVHFTRSDLRALAARGVTINTIHVDRLPLPSTASQVPRPAPQDVAASAEFLLAQDCCVTGQVLDLVAQPHPLLGTWRRRAPRAAHGAACSCQSTRPLPVSGRGD